MERISVINTTNFDFKNVLKNFIFFLILQPIGDLRRGLHDLHGVQVRVRPQVPRGLRGEVFCNLKIINEKIRT